MNNPTCQYRDIVTTVVSGFSDRCVPNGLGGSVRVTCTSADGVVTATAYSGSGPACTQRLSSSTGPPGSCLAIDPVSFIVRCGVTSAAALQLAQSDLAASKQPPPSSSSDSGSKLLIIAIAGGGAGLLLIALAVYLCRRNKAQSTYLVRVAPANRHEEAGVSKDEI